MHLDGERLGAAKASPATPPVPRRVGVQDLPPHPAPRHPHEIVRPGNRREVAHGQDDVVGGPGPSDEADHARLVVVGVDPLEPARPRVQLVQGRFGPVEVVEVLDQPLNPEVRGVLQEVPVKALLVVPLVPLPELPAHEQ